MKKPKENHTPTLEEILSNPPVLLHERDGFYDFQDMIGIHWFKRPKERPIKIQILIECLNGMADEMERDPTSLKAAVAFVRMLTKRMQRAGIKR